MTNDDPVSDGSAADSETAVTAVEGLTPEAETAVRLRLEQNEKRLRRARRFRGGTVIWAVVFAAGYLVWSAAFGGNFWLGAASVLVAVSGVVAWRRARVREQTSDSVRRELRSDPDAAPIGGGLPAP